MVLGIICVLIGVLIFLYICALMKSGALSDKKENEERWIKEYLKRFDEKRNNNECR